MTREQEHCNGAASGCCLSTPQASSFALPPSNASGRLGRTVYWLSHHVEQNHNERYPSNHRKTINITFTLERFYRAFLVEETIFPSTATCVQTTAQHATTLNTRSSTLSGDTNSNVRQNSATILQLTLLSWAKFVKTFRDLIFLCCAVTDIFIEIREGSWIVCNLKCCVLCR